MAETHPLPTRRLIIGGAIIVLLIALSFVSTLVLGFVSVFVPVIVGATFMIMGITRNIAPWPWLVGIGFGIIPASYMAFVKTCGKIGGICPTGDELRHEQQAAISLALFAIAALIAIFTKRSPIRDAVVAGITLIAEIWLVIKLRGIDELSGELIIIALIVAGVAYEIVTRMRAEPETATPPA